MLVPNAPRKLNTCLMTPSGGEEGGSSSFICFWWASKLGWGRDFTCSGDGLHIFTFWSSALHVPRTPSDFLKHNFQAFASK
jgi:hypothetical protein